MPELVEVKHHVINKTYIMYRRLTGILLGLIIGRLAIAQQENGGVFNSPVVPGPNGAFIYVVDSSKALRKPPRERIFSLYKEEKKGAGFRKVTDLSFPSSSADLDKKLGPQLLQEILQNRKNSFFPGSVQSINSGSFLIRWVFIS